MQQETALLAPDWKPRTTDVLANTSRHTRMHAHINAHTRTCMHACMHAYAPPLSSSTLPEQAMQQAAALLILRARFEALHQRRTLVEEQRREQIARQELALARIREAKLAQEELTRVRVCVCV